MGVYGFVGVKGCGKTFKAIEMARVRGRFIVFDFGGAKDFLSWPRVSGSPKEVQNQIYKLFMRKPEVNPVWTPDDPHEAGELCALIRKDKLAISVVFDEAWYVWSPSHIVKEVSAFIRLTRHHYGDGYYTSQRYGDLSQDAHGTTDVLHVFRCTSPRDLDRLKSEKNLDREHVATLEKYKYIEVLGGFQA